jgi:dolichol kinase
MMAAALSFSRQRPSSLLVDDARRNSSRTASNNHKGLPALQQTEREMGEAETESTASSSTSTTLIAIVGTSLLALCIGGAYTGILPGYTAGTDGAVVDPSLIVHDVGMTVLAAVLGYAFVKINTLAVRAGVLDPRDARKVIHTGAAPLFILFWPGFETRFFAAIIPILNALRLFLAARDTDSELAAAVSRSGDIKEAVGGPFVYVIMIIACLLIYWTTSPVGVVALCTLAAGDGLADLVGRRWGKSNPWPGLPGNKSVVGSLAFWSASTAVSYGILLWLQYNHCLTLNNVDQLLFRLAAVTLVAAVVELIPNLDDNYTVPISAAAVAAVLLQ